MKAKTARDYVAEGNGLTADQLPKFKPHIHPETGIGLHRGWADCEMTYCTWAAR